MNRGHRAFESLASRPSGIAAVHLPLRRKIQLNLTKSTSDIYRHHMIKIVAMRKSARTVVSWSGSDMLTNAAVLAQLYGVERVSFRWVEHGAHVISVIVRAYRSSL